MQRQGAIDRITAALEADATVVIIASEAGGGRSRVADEVATALRARGWSASTVAGTSIMSGVPLGALSPYLEGDRSELAAAAADPAGLFTSAVRAIEHDGATGRRLLVVDDLALLDPVSTTLVAQLTATGLLRLLVTTRTGDPLPDPVLAIWRPDRSLRVDLEPLSVDGVEALLVTALGGPVARRTATELHEASRGNPLMLRELVAGALAAGRLRRETGVWQTIGAPVATPALRELILARIVGLAPLERDVVDRLAVCGALPVARLAHPGARAALQELERAGLVTITQDLHANLAHPQYASVLTEAMPRLRAIDLLLDQADEVERAGRTAADELRVAMWRLDAGVDSDPAILESAARLAERAGDHSTVERLAGAAVRSGGGVPIRELHGRALLRQGRVREALETLEAATALAVPGTAEANAVAATTALAHATVHGGLERALDVLRRAQADTGEPDPSLGLINALITLFGNRAHEADRLVLAVAELLGDSAAERAIIAAARAQPLAALGREREALEAAQTALAFARATDGQAIPGHTVANALLTLATVQLNTGDVVQAQETATTALIEAIVDDDEIITRSIEFLLGRIALEAGRPESSARWYRDTMSGAMTVGPISLYIPGLAALAHALATTGDVDAARALMREVPDGVEILSASQVTVAWLDALEGDVVGAVRRLRDLADEFAASGQRYLASYFLFTMVRVGAAGDAIDGLRALAAEADSSLFRLQARHAAAEATGDRAELEAVADDWAARGAILLAAEATASAARAARRNGDPRSAVALQARAEELAARCEGATTPLLRFTDELSPLTRREREIAALAAAGASSKEIAAKLYLSTRTVDNHLQSVYGKLGISGRHELVGR